MIAPNAEQWSQSDPTPNSSLPTPPKDLLKGAAHTKRSHVSNSRIKAAARKCAAKIKALVEAHDADIEAAYQEYRETVAQIEQREVHAK